MSNQTAFPDAIVFPDGTIRLVTVDAKSWAYSNTDIKNDCTASTVADYIDFEDSVAETMEYAGLVIKRERQPAFHYRSKRRRWPKSTSDGNVIKFLEKIPESYRQDAMFRAFGRHKARNWRLMQERDEKRQEELQGELTES
jgi:hypothetical protein